jgi:hypothetical protein
MNRRFAAFTLLAALTVAGCLASVAFAQDAAVKPHALYLSVPPHSYYGVQPSSHQLTQWTYHFTYQGTQYSPVIVGTSPAKTNVTTTVPVFIIPIKLVFGKTNGNHTYDPNKDIYPGSKLTVTKYIAQSPIFVPIKFTEGGVNLGTTQYEDAYERGSFWKYVKKNNKYHVLVGKPTILAEQTVKVGPGQGSIMPNPFGKGNVGFWADFNTVDSLIQSYLPKFKQVQPNALPLFLIYNTYVACGNGCAIGGWHTATNGPPSGQTYSISTTINPGGFASSTGALSHEFGEWMLDPFTTNPGCGGLMENGDPLENESNPLYGLYSYKAKNGLTYQLQDLTFVDYFGAPRSTSLKNWFTFRNSPIISAPCDHGQD